MRSMVILILVLAVSALLFGSLSTPYTGYDPDASTPATRQHGYRQINSVTADDTPLAANTKYWDSVKGTFVQIEPTWNRVQLSFYGYGDGSGDGDPNGGTFSFKVFAVKRYGSAKIVYEGYAAVGEVELSVYPADDPANAYRAGDQVNSGSLDPNESYKWADTVDPNGDCSEWIGDVGLAGNGGAATGGDIAIVDFDCFGYYGLWCEITNMTSKPITSIVCVATGY